MRQPDIAAVIDQSAIEHLIAALKADGYKVIGPCLRDGAIVYEPVDSLTDLPIGYADKQDGGKYRLT